MSKQKSRNFKIYDFIDFCYKLLTKLDSYSKYIFNTEYKFNFVYGANGKIIFLFYGDRFC